MIDFPRSHQCGACLECLPQTSQWSILLTVHRRTSRHPRNVKNSPSSGLDSNQWDETTYQTQIKGPPFVENRLCYGRVSTGFSRACMLYRRCSMVYPPKDMIYRLFTGLSQSGYRPTSFSTCFDSQVTVRSQSGHSRVSSQVTVGSWFFTYKLKFIENQGEADDAY